MRTTAIRCDRCRTAIEADGTVVEAAAGALRRRRGPISIDLCNRCCDSFVAWLDGAAASALAAPPESPT